MFHNLLELVMKNLYNLFHDEEIWKFKDKIKHVYENERKSRSESLSYKMKVLNHIIDTSENNSISPDDIVMNEKELNFYDVVCDIFDKLCEKYNDDSRICDEKSKLLQFYDNENNYRYKSVLKKNWYIDSNGKICM